MRVTRVRLSNFTCYASADVSLGRGVTVIHGPNGAGKSSLLEAVFFALYGARALDATLDDLVTRGAEDAEVEVHFVHAGGEYAIERRIRATGERAQTASCVLETPEDVVEGATDVREAVVSLLRMDAEAFVNCAYVRQGEVNKLVNATPTERQSMLDELLQLGTLERYRERAASARLGVADVAAESRGRHAQVVSQIEEKEAADLHERRNQLGTELASVAADLERFEANREAAQETLETARGVLADHEANTAALESLAAEVESLSEAIAETERERERLAERVADRRERAASLADERDELAAAADLDAVDDDAVEAALVDRQAALEALDERRQALEIERTETRGTRTAARERAEELAAEAEAARETAAELDEAVASAETALEERRTKLVELEAAIEDTEARFEDAPVEPGGAEDHRASLVERREGLREERGDRQAALETTRHQVEHAEGLLEAGRCPECGQTVEGSPHVDSLDEVRERLAEETAALEAVEDRLTELAAAIERADELVAAEREADRLAAERASLEQLLAEREAAIEGQRERAAEARERAEALDVRAAAERETATAATAELESLEDSLEAVATERDAAASTVETLEGVAERLEQLSALEVAVERLVERRALLAERNDERRETLAEKRERREELEAAVDEATVAEARENESRAEAYLERVEPKLEGLRERRDGLQGDIGAVENELEALESLRERRGTLAASLERLESLHAEAESLEATYGDLRAELRRQNIASLERLLNETFELVYQNDAYARIELDHDYGLTVYQKDGEPLAPEQLSGGERALFNLSLRTAIYRLLSEGIEGAAPMPPLILDEPTVFLDAGHVAQLVELVGSMRELGVEQIVVVSHDEELIGAADELLTVHKDATTNRSSVERGAQPEALAD